LIILILVSCNQKSLVLDQPLNVGDTITEEWLCNVLEFEVSKIAPYNKIVYLSQRGCPNIPKYILNKMEASTMYILSDSYNRVYHCDSFLLIKNCILDVDDKLQKCGLNRTGVLQRNHDVFTFRSLELN
jgi:hypothetical protein